MLLALLPAVCVRGAGGVRHGLRRTHLDADRSQRGPGLHEGEDPHQYVPNISFFSLFKKRGQQNHPHCLRLILCCFAHFFGNGLINTHRTQCVRFLCMTYFRMMNMNISDSVCKDHPPSYRHTSAELCCFYGVCHIDVEFRDT